MPVFIDANPSPPLNPPIENPPANIIAEEKKEVSVVPAKHAGGRPRKELPENWRDIILDLSSKGKTIEQICFSLDICRDHFYERAKRDTEFKDIVSRAKENAEAWYIETAQQHLIEEKGGKRINSSVYALTMANKFGWHGKNDQRITINQPPALNITLSVHGGTTDAARIVDITPESLPRIET